MTPQPNNDFEQKVIALKIKLHDLIVDKPLGVAQVAIAEVFAALMVRMGETQGEPTMLRGFHQLMRGCVQVLKRKSKTSEKIRG